MQYLTHYDGARRLLWGYFAPLAVPSFTPQLLDDVQAHEQSLDTAEGPLRTSAFQPVNYYAWASRTPGYFSLGGDLAHFVDCIERRDHGVLLAYATQCVDILHRRIMHYQASPLITLALVQGPALGGGLEAALANDVLIAEEHATFGFPEILFNLFPGMGGYSLLRRRIGMRATEAMMGGGATYSAQACLAMGVVDRVVPTGTGVAALHAFVDETQARHNGLAAMHAAREVAMPISHEELLTITAQWVDAALRLSPANLVHMKHLVQRQRTRLAPQP